MSSQLLVRSMTAESDGVLSVELVDAHGHELPSWEPGAHLDVQLTAGLSRQYSLSGDPHDRVRYRDRGAEGAGGARRDRRTCTTCCARVSWSATPARATTSGSSRRRRTCSSPGASASRRSCR